jgi:ribonucleotide monophosphatase NagD (HAD superfamily)
MAVRAASGREPVIVGKPYPGLAEGLERSTGIPAAETLFVGDRLDTDIDFGLKAGMQTVLVLTGVSSREDLVEGAPRPHHVLEDLQSLPALLEELGAV